MKKIHFVAAARDGNMIADGYYSEEGVFLKYDAENPEQTEERKLKSLYDILQRKDIFIIHILDTSDAGAEQQLYLPPRPEWITTVGWNDLTRTEAIIWTCLMISYRIDKSVWVEHDDLDHILRVYRRSPNSLIEMIRSIRRKIKDTKWHIQNHHGTGYRLSEIDMKVVAKNTYTNAHAAGEPKHKLATITEKATGLPAHRIRRWATKYQWIDKNEKT